MNIVEDKGSVSMDRLCNAVPCTSGCRVGMRTTMITATTGGWRFPSWLTRHSPKVRATWAQHTSGRTGGSCRSLSEARLLVFCAIDLACD